MVLCSLRDKISCHRNGLIAGSSQTSRLEDRVDQVTTMLKEIHQWFTRNLRDATSTTQTVTIRNNDQSSLLPDLSFELFTESVGEPELVCCHACLNSNWNSKHSGAVAGGTVIPGHLFTCRCTNTCQNSDVQSHQAKVAPYGLS
jgi:hypothetical protein